MITKSVQKEGGGEGGRLGSQEVNQKESEKTKPEANCIKVDQNALRSQHVLLFRKARDSSTG